MPVKTIENPSTQTADKCSLSPLYWVVMHNDPVTTMEFVVEILIQLYGFDHDHAVETMYTIHNAGLAKVALMPFERAEFKVESTHKLARTQGYPLTCSIEPE